MPKHIILTDTVLDPADVILVQRGALPQAITGLAADTYTVRDTSASVSGAVADGALPETHVFLLAGQSNMVGRPTFDGGAGYPAGTLQVARTGAASGGTDGQLVAAADPLDHWAAQAGDMGLANQFVNDYMAENPGITVVLVPAAKGGAGFVDNHWNPGDDLYADAVARVNALMAANPGFLFKGILWHQGEREVSGGNPAATYQAQLDATLVGFRNDIVAASSATPIVLGGLLPSAFDGNAIQSVIYDTANRVPYTYVASSAALTDQGDNLHFNAASLRTLGARYATALPLAAANAPAVPAQVTGLTAAPGDGQVTLSWAAPVYNRAPITDYRIEVSTDAGASWSVVADGVSTATGYTHAGLTNGTAYLYRVAAINSIGTGSSATTTATPQAAGSSPVSILAYDDAGIDSTTATYNFTGMTVGTGDAVALFTWRKSSTASAVASITIGGVAATVTHYFDIALGQYAAIARLNGVSAGTVNVVLTLSGGTADRAGVALWTLDGANTDGITYNTPATSSLSSTIDVTEGAALLAVGVQSGPASTYLNWSGATERAEWFNYGDTYGSGSADLIVTADETARAVSASGDGNAVTILLANVPAA